MTALAPELAAEGVAWGSLERVGAGASAEVFRARLAAGMDVALKVFREDAAAGELALLAALDRRWGPSLVSAGRVPAGTSLRAGARWIATTWTDGRPLDEVVRETEPAARRALALVVAHGVARALAELHAMGIVHGDVKLANILVRGAAPDSDRAERRGATLIDTGLARAATGDPAQGGTFRYLAPELRRGEAHGPAADLFALGLVLAEIEEPSLAGVADPAAGRAAERASHGDPTLDAWIAALLAAAPGARPAASWVADRAAQALGLTRDEEEAREERRARVRRTYLAVRRAEIRAGALVDGAITGAPRAWLERAIGAATLAASVDGGEAGAAVEKPGLEGAAVEPARLRPLDALGRARWLVALVGPAAASWPDEDVEDGVLASRLESLAAERSAGSWTADDVRAPVAARIPGGHTVASANDPDWLALTRALLEAYPSDATLAAAEDAVATSRAPLSVVHDLGAALLRRGDIGRAFVAVRSIAQGAEAPAELALLGAEIARRRGDLAAAEAGARQVLSGAPTFGAVSDDAAALLARLAWDRGALDEATAALDGARGAAAAEVRALVAYARGEPERGLVVLDEAARAAS
ncbi:MAG: Response regulator of zinc sigma-54-dependent two-component system, partial [Labilithrix sp.]|nr:Response regulator of zinc sigma-54-dependent two-component system [Labilithrix sp.]